MLTISFPRASRAGYQLRGQPALDNLAVLLQPGTSPHLRVSGFVDRQLQLPELLLREVDVIQELERFRSVLFEPFTGNSGDLLRTAHLSLGVFEVTDVEGGEHPVRLPGGEGYRLITVQSLFQFADHRRGARRDQIVVQPVPGDGVLLDDFHNARPRLDAYYRAAELVAVLVEVFDGLRLDVVRDADAQSGRALVPLPQIYDLILVLFPVARVGIGQPDVQERVYVAGRYAAVQGSNLRERRLHVVAELFFEQDRCKVRNSHVLIPVDVADGDRVVVASPTATLSSAAPASADEPDEQTEHEREQRLPTKSHVLPLPCFRNASPSIRDASQYCTVTPLAPQALRFRPTVLRTGMLSRLERELEVRDRLDGAGGPEEHGLGEVVAHELDAHGEPFAQPARDTYGRDTGEVHGDGAEVLIVHGEWVIDLLADPERHRRRGWGYEHIVAREGFPEILYYLCPHLLGLSVVSVVVATGQGVGAEHDASLGLIPEALLACPAVHLVDTLGWGPVAVAHPVEAGQVRGDLGRGDDVVGGQPVARVRQARLPHLGPRAFEIPCDPLDDLAHARLDTLAH